MAVMQHSQQIHDLLQFCVYTISISTIAVGAFYANRTVKEGRGMEARNRRILSEHAHAMAAAQREPSNRRLSSG